MKQKKKSEIIDLIPQETVESKILLFRGRKIILDRDLAVLYGVETKYLKRQVRRNLDRFPLDFMFELSRQEFKNWRRQFVTSNSTAQRLKIFINTENQTNRQTDKNRILTISSDIIQLALFFYRPHRLAWSRTSPFHGDDASSNLAGDALFIQV